MEYKDYYQILGVSKTATDEEIKHAYRELAKKYHPDQNRNDKNAEQRFKEINEAYEVLKDKNKRARYDQLGSSYKAWEERGGTSADYNWSDWFSHAQQANRPNEQTYQTYYSTGDFGDMGDFSDFFSQIFGGMNASRRSQAAYSRTRRTRPTEYDSTFHRPAPVQHYQVPITLNEAYHGTTRVLMIGDHQIEAKIPAGANTGTKIRLAGILDSDEGKGDLMLDVLVEKDNRFERKDDDLYININIDLYTAVMGGEVPVSLIDEQLMLTIPAGTQPGQLIRLSGKGMPKLRMPSQRGDLYARIQVNLPKNLNSKQKALFEELKKAS